jgi:hypothetical protein
VAEVAAWLEAYGAAGTWISVPGASLTLSGPARPAAGVTAMSPRRVHAARLRYAWWRPSTPVTVEVDRWSRTACEIVVRPGRRSAPPDDYLRADATLVDALVGELELDRMRAEAPAPAARSALRRAS